MNEALILDPEVTDEMIREELKSIGNQMALQYHNDPGSVDAFGRAVMAVLKTESWFDALESEQRWIWGTFYPALRKINKVVEDYKAHRKNSDLERIPTLDDLIFLETSYSEPWFRDCCTNLYKRKNVFEQTLAHDIEIVMNKLTVAITPEILDADYVFGKIGIKPETAEMIVENPDFIIRAELKAMYGEN